MWCCDRIFTFIEGKVCCVIVRKTYKTSACVNFFNRCKSTDEWELFQIRAVNEWRSNSAWNPKTFKTEKQKKTTKKEKKSSHDSCGQHKSIRQRLKRHNFDVSVLSFGCSLRLVNYWYYLIWNHSQFSPLCRIKVIISTYRLKCAVVALYLSLNHVYKWINCMGKRAVSLCAVRTFPTEVCAFWSQ